MSNDLTQSSIFTIVNLSNCGAVYVNNSTGYQSHRAEFEHIDFYQAPVQKNNIPVRLALLGGWVSLNTEIVGVSTPNFYTDIMWCRKNDTAAK